MLFWQKIKMVAFVAMMAFGAAATLPVAQAQALKCEEGSLRGAGAEVENIADCNVLEAKEDNDLPSLVETVIGILTAIIGVVTVAVIIYGATQLVLSGGDPGKVKTGRMAIIAGITGLVIAIMAWAIIGLVLNSIKT